MSKIKPVHLPSRYIHKNNTFHGYFKIFNDIPETKAALLKNKVTFRRSQMLNFFSKEGQPLYKVEMAEWSQRVSFV